MPRTIVVVESSTPTTSIAPLPATTVSSQTESRPAVPPVGGADEPSGDGTRSADPGETPVISRQASGSGLGAEWSALMASTLAALVGGWYAFQRNRRPTVRLGDDS